MKSYHFRTATTLSTLLAISTAVYAVAIPNGALPGFYLGGQTGYSELYYTRSSFNASSGNINNAGIGGRAYFGYQLNHYIGGEAGYTAYAMADTNNMTVNSQTVSGTIRHQAYDVVLKGTYPLVDSGFNLYGKAGVAYTRKTVSWILCATGGQCAANAALFTYGVGATYNLWPNVPIDFSWTRVEHNTDISNSDLAAIGIAYYFG